MAGIERSYFLANAKNDDEARLQSHTPIWHYGDFLTKIVWKLHYEYFLTSEWSFYTPCPKNRDIQAEGNLQVYSTSLNNADPILGRVLVST